MGLVDDPISGIIGAIFQHEATKLLAKRLTLILEMVIAGLIAFLTARGLAIISGQPSLLAEGAGDVTAAVAIFATFQASANSKGLIISVTSKVAEQKIDDPTTTIERK